MDNVKKGDILGQLKADFKKEPIKMGFVVVVIILVVIGLFQSPATPPEKQSSEVATNATITEKIQVESTKTNDDLIQHKIPEANDATFNKTTYSSNYVYVKYRITPVDVGNPRFEYLDTSASSFVRGAWYDSINQYMVIKLNTTYYHYCSMPKEIWELFKKAVSFGTFYNNYIKGSYDCRLGFVPEYEKQSSVDKSYYNYNWQPSGYSYSYYSNGSDDRGDVYVYGDCEEGSYCYGEDSNGNEVEMYVYSLEDGYGYGEDEDGNEVEFYYDE